jgi:outer membrane immunogenic protein
MRRLFVAGIVIAVFGVTQAIAADAHVPPADPLADFPYVPQPPPPLPPPPPPRLFSWTSCYLGLQFGGGVADTLVTGAWLYPAVPTRLGVTEPVAIGAGSYNEVTTGGVLAGGQGGCDIQVAPHWVIGGAADGTWTNIGGNLGTETASGTLAGSTPLSATGVLNVRVDTLATATARIGYAFYGSGLFYVKGGAAWDQSKYGLTGTITSTVTQQFNFTATDSRVGWTVGVGTEWMLIGNWSFFGEYDYLDFGTRNVNFSDAVMGTSTLSARQFFNEFKLGVNYRFGAPFP